MPATTVREIQTLLTVKDQLSGQLNKVRKELRDFKKVAEFKSNRDTFLEDQVRRNLDAVRRDRKAQTSWFQWNEKRHQKQAAKIRSQHKQQAETYYQVLDAARARYGSKADKLERKALNASLGFRKRHFAKRAKHFRDLQTGESKNIEKHNFVVKALGKEYEKFSDKVQGSGRVLELQRSRFDDIRDSVSGITPGVHDLRRSIDSLGEIEKSKSTGIADWLMKRATIIGQTSIAAVNTFKAIDHIQRLGLTMDQVTQRARYFRLGFKQARLENEKFRVSIARGAKAMRDAVGRRKSGLISDELFEADKLRIKEKQPGFGTTGQQLRSGVRRGIVRRGFRAAGEQTFGRVFGEFKKWQNAFEVAETKNEEGMKRRTARLKEERKIATETTESYVEGQVKANVKAIGRDQKSQGAWFEWTKKRYASQAEEIRAKHKATAESYYKAVATARSAHGLKADQLESKALSAWTKSSRQRFTREAKQHRELQHGKADDLEGFNRQLKKLGGEYRKLGGQVRGAASEQAKFNDVAAAEVTKKAAKKEFDTNVEKGLKIEEFLAKKHAEDVEKVRKEASDKAKARRNEEVEFIKNARAVEKAAVKAESGFVGKNVESRIKHYNVEADARNKSLNAAIDKEKAYAVITKKNFDKRSDISKEAYKQIGVMNNAVIKAANIEKISYTEAQEAISNARKVGASEQDIINAHEAVNQHRVTSDVLDDAVERERIARKTSATRIAQSKAASVAAINSEKKVAEAQFASATQQVKDAKFLLRAKKETHVDSKRIYREAAAAEKSIADKLALDKGNVLLQSQLREATAVRKNVYIARRAALDQVNIAKNSLKDRVDIETAAGEKIASVDKRLIAKKNEYKKAVEEIGKVSGSKLGHESVKRSIDLQAQLDKGFKKSASAAKAYYDQREATIRQEVSAGPIHNQRRKIWSDLDRLLASGQIKEKQWQKLRRESINAQLDQNTELDKLVKLKKIINTAEKRDINTNKAVLKTNKQIINSYHKVVGAEDKRFKKGNQTFKEYIKSLSRTIGEITNAEKRTSMYERAKARIYKVTKAAASSNIVMAGTLAGLGYAYQHLTGDVGGSAAAMFAMAPIMRGGSSLLEKLKNRHKEHSQSLNQSTVNTNKWKDASKNAFNKVKSFGASAGKAITKGAGGLGILGAKIAVIAGAVGTVITTLTAIAAVAAVVVTAIGVVTAALALMAGGGLALTYVIKTLKDRIVKGFEFSGMVDRAKIQFEALTGSVENATRHIASLANFAATTPFQLGGIATASRHLLVYGGRALASEKNLRIFGDSAAVAGVQLAEVTFWAGRLYSSLQSGRPAGESMMRLQEMGLVSGTARNKIEELTKTTGGAKKAFALFKEELKKHEGTMKKMSETTSGLKSTLADLRGQVGGNMVEDVKNLMKEWTKLSIQWERDRLRLQELRKELDLSTIPSGIIEGLASGAGLIIKEQTAESRAKSFQKEMFILEHHTEEYRKAHEYLAVVEQAGYNDREQALAAYIASVGELDSLFIRQNYHITEERLSELARLVLTEKQSFKDQEEIRLDFQELWRENEDAIRPLLGRISRMEGDYYENAVSVAREAVRELDEISKKRAKAEESFTKLTSDRGKIEDLVFLWQEKGEAIQDDSLALVNYIEQLTKLEPVALRENALLKGLVDQFGHLVKARKKASKFATIDELVENLDDPIDDVEFYSKALTEHGDVIRSTEVRYEGFMGKVTGLSDELLNLFPVLKSAVELYKAKEKAIKDAEEAQSEYNDVMKAAREYIPTTQEANFATKEFNLGEIFEGVDRISDTVGGLDKLNEALEETRERLTIDEKAHAAEMAFLNFKGEIYGTTEAIDTFRNMEYANRLIEQGGGLANFTGDALNRLAGTFHAAREAGWALTPELDRLADSFEKNTDKADTFSSTLRRAFEGGGDITGAIKSWASKSMSGIIDSTESGIGKFFSGKLPGMMGGFGEMAGGALTGGMLIAIDVGLDLLTKFIV